MPVTITKVQLTGSTGGTGISITATQGLAPATIHTLSTCATTTSDEVYIYAQNDYSQSVDVILELGPSTTANHIVTPVPPRDGLTLLVPGLIFNRTACGTITAFVSLNGSGSLAQSAGNSIQVIGYANRIVQT